MEPALKEMAAATIALERTEETVSSKKVNAAKAALESAEEKIASMNRICAMVRETSLLVKVETFSDEDADIVVDEWINKRKLFNASGAIEQTMNHRKKASQTIRKVYFVPENNVTVLIENRVDFSGKEINQYWYSRGEMKKMQKLCIKVADLLESGDTKNRQLCGRGLETSTMKGLQTSTAAIKACLNAVIDEQGDQFLNACEDHNLLAIVSQEVSKHCVEQAVMRANEDEKEARKIQRLDQQKLNPLGSLIRKPSKTVAVVGTLPGYRIAAIS